jgi:putative membrane protein
MPLMRTAWIVLALTTVALAWLGPMPSMARESFAAHMTMHMALVAVAAPLFALALAGTPADLVRRMPRVASPVPASLLELVVVWMWHVPAWHDAARHHAAVFMLEQASFVLAGLLLWMSVLGGSDEQRRVRAGAGVAALLLTSMHMTLLGALFALANRPLFRHVESAAASRIADQQLGGVIMLLVGGASYLFGALWLTATVLRPAAQAVPGKEREA